ncbi:hypothetical protein [Mycobacterium sp.]|uniref:hypothetical protein n=1 Tax=Mycobacterium sp. TaxID=1785 RepID=UPI003BAA3FBA
MAVSAGHDLQVDLLAMAAMSQTLSGAAEHLAGQFAEFDAQMGAMLGGWRGAFGTAWALCIAGPPSR